MADFSSGTSSDVIVEQPAKDVIVERPTPSRLECRLLMLVVAMGLLVDYMLLTVVVPIFPHIKKKFDISVFGIGCLFSIKPALQAITDPILAPLVDRGWVWPFVAGLLLEVATTVCFAYSDSYALTMLSRALQGVASALIMTTGMALVARVHAHDDKARGIAMSLTVTGVAVGVSLGPPVGGILFEIGGMQLPFLVISGLTLLILCVAVPVIYLHVRWQRERDTASVSEASGKDALDSDAPTASTDSRGPLQRVLRDPYMVLIYGAIVFGNSALGMLEPTLGIWMEHDLHYSAGTIGFTFLGATLSTLAGGPIAGCLGNKFGRGPLIFLGVILLGVGYSSLTAGNGELWSIILALAIMGAGIGGVDGCSPALLGQIADLRHRSAVYGSVFALRGVAESIGFIVGPLIATALMDSIEFKPTTIILGICVALYAPLLLLLKFMPEFQLAKNESCSIQAQDVEGPIMTVSNQSEAAPLPNTDGENLQKMVVSV